MATKRRWVDEIVLVGDTRGFVGGLAQASFALNQVGFAVGAVARGLAAPTNAAHSFQVSLNQVAAVSQATTADMAALEAQALDMGASTKFSATEAADAQSFLAMAGMSVQQTMSALPATLALAAAGNLELADAADIATNVMTGYGLGVAELSRATDVIATVAASANTNVQQVGEAMKYAAPVASAAGMSFESAAAAVGLLSNAGIQADMAGTALRGMLTKLLTPSDKAAAIMKRLGVSVLDSSGEMRPFVDILVDFEAAGVTAGEAMAVFGQRAGPGMLALVSQGSGALTGLRDKLEESAGSAQRMADVQQQGLVGAMTEASSAASNLQIILGQALTPAVTAGLEAFTGGARAVGAWIRESETARVSSQAFGVAVAFVAGNAGGLTTAAVLLTAAYLAQRNQVVVLRTATLAWGVAVGTVRGVAAGYRLVVVGTTQAMALYRGGLLGARAAMLAKTAAVGAARLAMIGLKLAIASTGIGALVLLIGTGLVVAWSKWGDGIKAFLAGVWNRFIGAVEGGMEWIRPLAEWAGIKLPASLDTLKFTLDGTGQGLEKYAGSLEGAYAQHKRATEGIRAMEAAGQAVDPKLRNWTAGLERHIEKLGGTVPEIDALGDAAGNLGGELGGLGGTLDDTTRKVQRIGVEAGFAARLMAGYTGAAYQTGDGLRVVKASLDGLVPSAAGWSAEVRENMRLVQTEAIPGLNVYAAGMDLTTFASDKLAAGSRALGKALRDIEVPPSIGEKMLAGLRETWSPGNVSAIFVQAFTGGGGAEGAFKALGTQAGGHIAGGVQGFLDSPRATQMFGGAFGGLLKGAIGMAVPIIGPALGALGGWIAGKLFGGPSKEVQAARQSMDAYAASIEDMIGQSQSSIDRYQGWLAGGFTKAHATIVTHFQDLAIANGQASQAGVDLWLRYQQAVEDGNQAAIDAVMDQIEAWGGAKEAIDAAALAAAEHAEAVEAVKNQLLGLPTEETVADFELLREAWDSMSPEERAQGYEAYIAALQAARDAGVELTAAELEAVQAFEAMAAAQAAALETFQAGQQAELESSDHEPRSALKNGSCVVLA